MSIPGKVFNENGSIYKVDGAPGLLARNPAWLSGAGDLPVYEELTEALFRLSEEYGIEFPGIGCLIEPERRHTYSTLHEVDGLNLHHDMTKLPKALITSTLDKIITYYEDMSQDFSSRLWLADVSLRQCLYGKVVGEGAPTESEPQVYFVDIGNVGYDHRLNNIRNVLFGMPRVYVGGGFGGISGLDDDFYVLKNLYPQDNHGSFAQRLLSIANCQGAFYKVPTAWNYLQKN